MIIISIINHVLQNKNEKITSTYGNRAYTINGKTVTDTHKGIDLIDSVNKVDYIIAFEDGIVENARDGVQGYDETKSAGNYVLIKHENNYYTRYLHMENGSVKVKSGDTVTKGSVLGFIGASGMVTGAHLHFEIKKENTNVDPLPYLEGKLTIKQKTFLGTPQEENRQIDQIIINAKDNNLRVRKTPNGTILGYIKNGIYNILNKETKDGYDWYNIEQDLWVAYSDEWAKIIEKENQEQNEENQNEENQTEENKPEENKPEENQETKEDNEEDLVNQEENDYKLIYTCKKDGLYAINLYKDEKLYIKK